MEEGQERDCLPDEERYIIDDDDMQDSPTDCSSTVTETVEKKLVRTRD
jgi:hypothetical protein